MSMSLGGMSEGEDDFLMLLERRRPDLKELLSKPSPAGRDDLEGGVRLAPRSNFVVAAGSRKSAARAPKRPAGVLLSIKAHIEGAQPPRQDGLPQLPRSPATTSPPSSKGPRDSANTGVGSDYDTTPSLQHLARGAIGALDRRDGDSSDEAGAGTKNAMLRARSISACDAPLPEPNLRPSQHHYSSLSSCYDNCDGVSLLITGRSSSRISCASIVRPGQQQPRCGTQLGDLGAYPGSDGIEVPYGSPVANSDGPLQRLRVGSPSMRDLSVSFGRSPSSLESLRAVRRRMDGLCINGHHSHHVRSCDMGSDGATEDLASDIGGGGGSVNDGGGMCAVRVPRSGPSGTGLGPGPRSLPPTPSLRRAPLALLLPTAAVQSASELPLLEGGLLLPRPAPRSSTEQGGQQQQQQQQQREGKRKRRRDVCLPPPPVRLEVATPSDGAGGEGREWGPGQGEEAEEEEEEEEEEEDASDDEEDDASAQSRLQAMLAARVAVGRPRRSCSADELSSFLPSCRSVRMSLRLPSNRVLSQRGASPAPSPPPALCEECHSPLLRTTSSPARIFSRSCPPLRTTSILNGDMAECLGDVCDGEPGSGGGGVVGYADADGAGGGGLSQLPRIPLRRGRQPAASDVGQSLDFQLRGASLTAVPSDSGGGGGGGGGGAAGGAARVSRSGRGRAACDAIMRTSAPAGFYKTAAAVAAAAAAAAPGGDLHYGSGPGSGLAEELSLIGNGLGYGGGAGAPGSQQPGRQSMQLPVREPQAPVLPYGGILRLAVSQNSGLPALAGHNRFGPQPAATAARQVLLHPPPPARSGGGGSGGGFPARGAAVSAAFAAAPSTSKTQASSSSGGGSNSGGSGENCTAAASRGPAASLMRRLMQCSDSGAAGGGSGGSSGGGSGSGGGGSGRLDPEGRISQPGCVSSTAAAVAAPLPDGVEGAAGGGGGAPLTSRPPPPATSLADLLLSAIAAEANAAAAAGAGGRLGVLGNCRPSAATTSPPLLPSLKQQKGLRGSHAPPPPARHHKHLHPTPHPGLAIRQENLRALYGATLDGAGHAGFGAAMETAVAVVMAVADGSGGGTDARPQRQYKFSLSPALGAPIVSGTARPCGESSPARVSSTLLPFISSPGAPGAGSGGGAGGGGGAVTRGPAKATSAVHPAGGFPVVLVPRAD